MINEEARPKQFKESSLKERSAEFTQGSHCAVVPQEHAHRCELLLLLNLKYCLVRKVRVILKNTRTSANPCYPEKLEL